MKVLLLIGALLALYALWYFLDRRIVKQEGRKLIDPDLSADCPSCRQTVENCECHIPDEVKHAGLHALVKNVIDPEGTVLRENVEYHQDGFESLIRDIEADQNECPICGRDWDMIFDACSDCGFNPYSED